MPIAAEAVLPAELRERPQWLLWRLEERNGKPTKVPVRADDPRRPASTTDPATWATFEDAAAAVDSADGLGFVFSPDDEFCGVDLDGCLDVLGELDSAAAAIVLALDSYTETSPSGRGLHVLLRGHLNGGRHRGRLPSGPGLEVYDRGRFFTMTGEHLRGTPTGIGARQPQLEQVLAHFLPSAEPAAPVAAPAEPVDLDDRELLERAMRARDGGAFARLWAGDTAGYPSQSEADLALCGRLAFWTGRDAGRVDRLMRASGLMRPKWDRADYRGRTLTAALAGCRDVYSPRAEQPAPRPPESSARGASDLPR